jgi:uncharacterized protein YbbK (DUF523 family)
LFALPADDYSYHEGQDWACMKQTTHKIPVGISSCLLGQPVRYDGGHKYHRLINEQLANLFEFRPFCPEVAIGLGTPRAPVRLVRTGDGVRVLGVNEPSIDVTRQLGAYGRETAQGLADICGYIFKSHSPSCGMREVAVCNESGLPLKPDGVGAFANEIIRACPGLPVVDEDCLDDPELREDFIKRVYARHAQLMPDRS